MHLELLKSPVFANNEDPLRGLAFNYHGYYWPSLGNDFNQRRNPLQPHLLRVAEEGNAMYIQMPGEVYLTGNLLGERRCFKCVCVLYHQNHG